MSASKSLSSVNNPHFDSCPDSVVAFADLVMPVYPILPRPASLNFPPMPIWGRMGAIAYQQSDNAPYYCDGFEWLPFGSGGGTQGSQGYQGTQGSQGSQGSAGALDAGTLLYFHGTILPGISARGVRAIDGQFSIGSNEQGEAISPVPAAGTAIFCRAAKSGVFRRLYATFQIIGASNYTSTFLLQIVHAPSPVGDVLPTFTPTGISITFVVDSDTATIYSNTDLVNEFTIAQGDLYGVELLTNDSTGEDPNYIDIGLGFNFDDL